MTLHRLSEWLGDQFGLHEGGMKPVLHQMASALRLCPNHSALGRLGALGTPLNTSMGAGHPFAHDLCRDATFRSSSDKQAQQANTTQTKQRFHQWKHTANAPLSTQLQNVKFFQYGTGALLPSGS